MELNPLHNFMTIPGAIETVCVTQWLERPIVKRFSSRRVGSNPTVSHSKAPKQATHGTLFQSTRLQMSTRPRAWGRLAKYSDAIGSVSCTMDET